MLFVPMYKDLELGMLYQVIKSSPSFVDVVNDLGHADHRSSAVFYSRVKPITLKCPYCKETILQSPEIKCDCGWIAEAIPETQVNRLLSDLVHTVLASESEPETKTRMLYAIQGTEVNMDCIKARWKAKTIDIRKINRIYWIEIAGGKHAR